MPEEKNKEITQNIQHIQPRSITQEMKESYIDYAMSVIVSRALPDVRDGLKPVQRRILYAMYEMGLQHSAKFRKSATVVGSCLGHFHPHGDEPVYGALARMAQDFSLRYPLVKGQGNFGCFTRDTKVSLCDGRSLSFGELIKEQKQGKRHWTFSFNHKSKKVEVAEIKKPRLTKKNEKLIQITLDNGKEIRCTLDHRFMLRNGLYKMAKDLQAGDSLMPLYIKRYRGGDKNLKEYEIVLQPTTERWRFIHHLADAWNLAKGIYKRNAGRIRHHKDFNKYNNNPDNIIRIQWQDHWQFHREIASSRHRNDSDYIKKIAEGRRKFWLKKENRMRYAKFRAERNKEMWRSPKYRTKWIEARKKMWEDIEYKEFMREAASKNLKRLWQRKDFQELLSALKSKEMKKRWQNEAYRASQIQKMRTATLKMWTRPEYRDYMSRLMEEKHNESAWRRKQSEISKRLWEDSEYRRKVCKALKQVWQRPEYRKKYEKAHFSKMAKKLWSDPEMRKFLAEKAKKQWENPIFRRKMCRVARTTNKKRMQENPDTMRILTEKAKISLQKKWQNPAYKEQIIKNKILGYVYFLLKRYSDVTAEIYEKERYNNCFPRFENALNYFNSFSEIIDQAKKYNHKVVKIRILNKREDVYDLTVDPWHNFALDAGIFVHNSLDGDPPASMRYTETKLSKIGEETLKDIEKDTVDFMPNFDGTTKEPIVLPSPLPQLLLNGCLGIAVGMATNIPPHNLSELCDAVICLLEHPKAGVEELFEFVQGPDFPTGGIIYDKDAILTAYLQGKGSIRMRGKAEIKEVRGGARIIISEIPFGIQKSGLVQQIAKLVQDKKIQGVRDVRDESDREGIRVVVDLKQDSQPQRILNFLFRWTSLQTSFHMNMIALVDGIQPKRLNLAEILKEFLGHRTKILIRRTKFDLRKAKERCHILEGFHKALKNIDAIIKTIKASKDRPDAEKNLIKKFELTRAQANAILEMKLASLARLERQKIEDELAQIKERIKELTAILKSPQRIKNIIKKDLEEYKKIYGDERRTKVVSRKVGEISFEDLVPQEPAVITLTQKGYIKRVKPSVLRLQKRGGKGMLGQKTSGEDVVEHLIFSNTHDNLLFFTDSGKVFQTRVFEVPEAKRIARGKSLLNFLDIGSQEKVLTLLPFPKNEQEMKYFVMATKKGIIKKTAVSEFENVRKTGLIAINLKKGDLLKEVRKSKGEDDIILVTKKGKAIKFKEKDVRPMGRTAAGVKGIRLGKKDEVIGMEIIKTKELKNKRTKEHEKDYLLVVSENGYGKRTPVAEYRLQKRGGSGIKTANITKKTGELVAAKVLNGSEEHLMAISQHGHVIKMTISGISKIGRATQGVRIMRLAEGDKVASIAVI